MQSGIEWVVALGTPWAISPHPNFKQSNLRSYAKLALVVEQRSDRSDTHRNTAPEGGDSPSERRLLDAAQQSTTFEGLEAGSDELWRLAEDSELPVGMRVAAAAFAALAETERESAHRGLARLTQLDDSFVWPGGAEFKLVRAFLSQQIVARAYDAGQFVFGLRRAHDTLQMLEGSLAYEVGFELSRGISWSNAEVLLDLESSVRSSALGAVAYLEQFDGNTWQDVVREKGGWVDLKYSYRAGQRDQEWMRHEFEQLYEANSGVVRFGSISSGQGGYAALLMAELSGDITRIRGAREALGRIRAIRLARGENLERFEVVDALRYFRQARAKNPVRFLARRLRDVGPTSALVEDARAVIRRVLATRYVSEFDLTLISEASEFLDDGEVLGALEAIRSYLTTETLHPQYALSRLDQVWQASRRLMVFKSHHEQFSALLREDLEASESIQQPLEGAALRAASELDWVELSRAEQERWRQLFENRSGDESRFWNELRTVILPDAPNPFGVDDLRTALFDLEKGQSRLSAKVLQRHWDAIAVALRAEQTEAAGGATSFGSFETLELAVAFAVAHPSDSLWRAILDHVLDPNVSFDIKVRGVMRLVRAPEHVPPLHRENLRKAWRGLLVSRSGRSWGSSDLPIAERVEFLAAGVVFGVFEADELFDVVVRLSVGNQGQRYSVARLLPFIKESAWLFVLAVQLANDPDPAVRGEASYAVGFFAAHSATEVRLLERTLASLLETDGVRAKLRSLKGFADSARADKIRTLFPSQLQASLQSLRYDDSILVRSAVTRVERSVGWSS